MAQHLSLKFQNNTSSEGLRLYLVGIKLAKLVPGLKRVRRHVETSLGVMERAWCYALPPLTVCREAFQSEVGQAVAWGAVDDAPPADAPDIEL